MVLLNLTYCPEFCCKLRAVSYTHLDVYKRQALARSSQLRDILSRSPTPCGASPAGVFLFGRSFCCLLYTSGPVITGNSQKSGSSMYREPVRSCSPRKTPITESQMYWTGPSAHFPWECRAGGVLPCSLPYIPAFCRCIPMSPSPLWRLEAMTCRT